MDLVFLEFWLFYIKYSFGVPMSSIVLCQQFVPPLA